MKIYGASVDDVRSLAAFVKAQELPFPLLSDPDGSLAGKYDLLRAGGLMASRVTFVIDPEGVVRHIDTKVDVSKHGSDLAGVIQGLQAK